VGVYGTAGEMYDLLDMYEHEAAQQRLYNMKPDQLYMHLALQGELETLFGHYRNA
jgi:hypothetical protein